MHTYVHSKREAVWTVGYYEPRTDSEGGLFYEWRALKDLNTEEGAAAYTSYLNGGSKP